MPWDDEVSAVQITVGKDLSGFSNRSWKKLEARAAERAISPGARLNDGSHAEKAVSLARELLPVS